MKAKVNYRARRLVASLVIAIVSLLGAIYAGSQNQPRTDQTNLPEVTQTATALATLGELEVKGRAPKTDYRRAQFGDGWAIDMNGCDTRNNILRRDLTEVDVDENCKVMRGKLQDVYTGKEIIFVRGPESDKVQIDHVVALSNAWQTGAATNLSATERANFANDPLNLLSVDGDANQQKGDADAATWLPPNRSYRCAYVARQIAVKKAYKLWVTPGEKAAMERILKTCPDQTLPAR